MRRAAGEMRRYIRGHRMDSLWTLTNRELVTSWSEMNRRVERFLERKAAAGDLRPVAIVIEPHPSGHGWHVHFACRGFIAIDLVRAWWPYGYVWVSGAPRGRARGWQPSKLAGYLTKYLQKTMAGVELHGCEPRPKGGHRWWHPQGHALVEVRVKRPTLAELLEVIRRGYGQWDKIRPFAAEEGYRPEGYWLSFPDSCCRPPPRMSLV